MHFIVQAYGSTVFRDDAGDLSTEGGVNLEYTVRWNDAGGKRIYQRTSYLHCEIIRT
jgi:hypothetical protein